MTAEEILAIAQQYNTAAANLQTYLEQHGTTMKIKTYQALSALVVELTAKAKLLSKQAVVQFYIESIDALNELNDITKDIEGKIVSLQQLQTAINLVANAISLVAAISTGNVTDMAKSAINLVKDLQGKSDDDEGED